MGKMQRNKGANYERDLANYLTAHGLPAKRGIGQARSASEVPDVDLAGFWIECKRHKRTNPRAALAQAIEASAHTTRMPVAVCRDNGTHEDDATVTMRLVDWVSLVALFRGVTDAYIAERNVERGRMQRDGDGGREGRKGCAGAAETGSISACSQCQCWRHPLPLYSRCSCRHSRRLPRAHCSS